MKEFNEDIDKLFRDVVEPSENKPSQKVWDSIDKKIENSHQTILKKKYSRVLNSSIGISVAVISLVFLILNHNSKKKDHALTRTYHQVTNIADATITPVNTTEIEQITTIENKIQNGTSTSISEQSEQSNLIAISNNITALALESATRSETINKENLPTTSTIIEPTVNSIVNNTATSQPTKEIELKEETITEPILNNTTTVSESIVENIPDATPVVTETQTPLIETKTEMPAATIDTLAESTTVNEVLNAALNEQKEEVKSTASTVDTISTAKNSPDTVGTGIINPVTGIIPMKAFKFFAGAFFSPDKIVTNIVDANINSNTLDEKINYSAGTGIKLGYQFGKHWSISTHVVYSSISSSYNYSKMITSKDAGSEEEEDNDHHTRITHYLLSTTFGVVDVPVSNTDNASTPHSEHNQDTAKLNITGTDKFNYISVPLKCHYSIGSNRLSGYISIGFAANFLTSKKTDITDNISGNHYSPEITGLSKVYYNASIGIGVQYRIWQRISVFAEPSFKQSITSINTNVPIKTYPSMLGVSGGILFHF